MLTCTLCKRPAPRAYIGAGCVVCLPCSVSAPFLIQRPDWSKWREYEHCAVPPPIDEAAVAELVASFGVTCGGGATGRRSPD